ncbi:hypothetical protein PUN28_015018 [Cardiocondyla obscurior]|uniref:Ribosomal protein S14 n=1 Tax=Cardiocondyla obscurior TaxID=286306 RepID=A0AAW2EY93_9HYME
MIYDSRIAEPVHYPGQIKYRQLRAICPVSVNRPSAMYLNHHRGFLKIIKMLRKYSRCIQSINICSNNFLFMINTACLSAEYIRLIKKRIERRRNAWRIARSFIRFSHKLQEAA